jgi:hypothetical protein
VLASAKRSWAAGACRASGSSKQDSRSACTQAHPIQAATSTLDGYNYDQPNTLAFGNFLSTSRSDYIKGPFTASQFPNPAAGHAGSLGRSTFEGPGLANLNLNAIRLRIPWIVGREGATLEFRSEIFNLFGRVNLNQPSSDLSSGLFGKSTSQ